MLQIVLKLKFFINDNYHKNYHTLSYFEKCMHCFTLMLITYCKVIDLIVLQNNENLSFGVERPLSVYPTLRDKSPNFM